MCVKRPELSFLSYKAHQGGENLLKHPELFKKVKIP